MLQEIRITNFAIIENLAIEFHFGRSESVV